MQIYNLLGFYSVSFVMYIYMYIYTYTYIYIYICIYIHIYNSKIGYISSYTINVNLILICVEL